MLSPEIPAACAVALAGAAVGLRARRHRHDSPPLPPEPQDCGRGAHDFVEKEKGLLCLTCGKEKQRTEFRFGD